ncbi:shikimate dehydrogenase [Vagococcus elongatus]|uniref:Shikimate dehydrogenase (NADP(+)) n=1 Tax=Vagococcus elongatus TaxID=180344 RepID=A0A430ASF6_9ENTE|nr:shikimate dehydrogenase [Vagococcus elongatus]RSU10997.1 shikimate dehydrogenase [Vagococcus elongatus]
MITGATRLAAVLAKPIKHSLSPFIHNSAFKLTQTDGVYLAFEIEKEDLAQSIETIRRWDMYGVNLSMPYKQAVIPYMDELATEVTLIGAMNTVVNQQGKLVGYNTDGIGFINSLADHQVTAAGKKVVVLGAGGAAMAIITQLALAQAEEIIIFKRYNSRSEKVAAQLEKIQQAAGTKISLIPLENQKHLKATLASADILVNTTSVGMTPEEEISLIPAPSWLPSDLFVADIIYQPQQTLLLKQAEISGCRYMNGIGMLIHQAAEAFYLWTGEKMPVKIITKKIKEML